jgi:hypothetical protein
MMRQLFALCIIAVALLVLMPIDSMEIKRKLSSKDKIKKFFEKEEGKKAVIRHSSFNSVSLATVEQKAKDTALKSEQDNKSII